MPNVSPNIKGRGGRGNHRGRSKLAPKKTAVNLSSGTELPCKFCILGSEDEKVFGKLHSLDNVAAHYNCLLFSSGLSQNGEEEEGIEGFFLEDIRKELKRSTKLKCCYCRQNGASIGCLERRCKRSYHFLCGLKASALFQFTGNFSSFCVAHRPLQEGVDVGKEVECPICMEELIADPKTAVWAPCCKKDDWFHKDCMQSMANSAGYFFKCPLCNDKDTFTEAMQLCGIHVPEQDAEWELEPNAFGELYERRIHCDAPVCKCPEGRKQDDEGTRWEIILCDLCGTTGIHIVCGKLSFTCTKWNCSSCVEMLSESSKRLKQEDRERRLAERKVVNPRGKGRGSRSGRQSLNITISDSNPSRTLITSRSPASNGRGDRARKRDGRQSLNVTISDNSQSRRGITAPSTPKRRRTSDSLVLPRKIARIENTPIKEAKRALLNPNKEPIVALERIKITHISNLEDIDIDVEDKVSLTMVSRSLTKLMECETSTSSSDITNKEITSFGANKSDMLEHNCDTKVSDTFESSDLEINNLSMGKDVDESEISISVSELVSNIDEEKKQELSPVDNISLVEESCGELPKSEIELRNVSKRESNIKTLKETKQTRKDMLSQSELAPTKDKGVKSTCLNLDSNGNYNISSSDSTKDELVSPVKSLNKIKSIGGDLDTEKNKSSVVCDNQIDRKCSETSEVEETPRDPLQKMEELPIKMRSSPRKHKKSQSTSTSSKTGKTTPCPATATVEGTVDLSNSIVEEPCGSGSLQSSSETLRTSPRNSFGSASLLGSPTRKVPKSWIASPEKIAQGCILMYEEDLDEISCVPTGNHDVQLEGRPSECDENLEKSLSNDSGNAVNTHQEELLHCSPENTSSKSNKHILSDTRIVYDEHLVPSSNQDFIINKESKNVEIEKKEQSNSAISVNVDSLIDESERILCNDQFIHVNKQNSAIVTESIQNKENSNSAISHNVYSSVDESERIQCNVELVPGIRKQDCTIAAENLVNEDNEDTNNSNTAISHNIEPSSDQSERRPASIENQGKSHSTTNKASKLKALRCIRPVSKLRNLRINTDI